MSRKHEAVDLLRKGHPPSKIANLMGVSVATVMQYLYNQVGEGEIRRSDILFSIDKQTRSAIEHCISEQGRTDFRTIWSAIQKSGSSVDWHDLRVYLELRDARVALGDMYELVRDVELTVHGFVRRVLIEEYGDRDWWRSGIPESIRVECAAAREKDAEPAEDPYCYTTFIQLAKILDHGWGLFSKKLPVYLASRKKTLISTLEYLNGIRNRVMHPVKAGNLTEEEFDIVRRAKALLDYLSREASNPS